MKLDAFDYDLPDGRIATAPARPREAAKLLDMTCADGFLDRQVRDFPDLCQPGDVIVVNNTAVISARLSGYRGAAKISITLHKCEISMDTCNVPSFSSHWRVFAKPAKKCRVDDTIVFGDDFAAHILGRGEGGDVAVCFINPKKNNALVDGPELENCLARYGTIPLPPYISRPDGATTADETDYQTMFARHPGAVAAPTAGLHFTPALAAQLTGKNVSIVEITLHVGAGTFLPVTVDDIADHKMHAEWGAISSHAASIIQTAQQSGHRIIAVGTTSLRILEACFQQHGSIQAFAGETDIFIRPGFKFGVVDALLTNFHLPKSTLLMLISAFSGMRNVRDAYQHAIAGDYRFFSYGDACFMRRAVHPDIVTSLRSHAREKSLMSSVPEFGFHLQTTDGMARRGQLTTAWGIVETPVFMPVGTAATVKGMMPNSVAATGAQIILANTYHLMLRPGPERVSRLGGVRKMMGWEGPLLTRFGRVSSDVTWPIAAIDRRWRNIQIAP